MMKSRGNKTWRQRLRPGRWLVLAGAILLAASIVSWNLTPSPTIAGAAERKAAERVERSAKDEVQSSSRPAGDYISGNAVIEPADREVQVAGGMEGRITDIHVTEGQWVEAGTLLVTFEHDIEKATSAVADAKARQAAAEVRRLLRGNRDEDVAAAEAEVKRLEAMAAMSQDEEQRVELLVSSGALPAQQLEQSRLRAAADRAAVQRAAAQRDALRSGYRSENKAAARAALTAAKANHSQAEAVLRTRFVKAPRAGEVLQIKYRPGEYYRPGHSEPLVVLGDTRRLRARVDVYERDIGALHVGARTIVRAPAFGNTDFEGEVVHIARRMGRKNIRSGEPGDLLDTKILEVLVELQQTERLISGQRVVAYIETSSAGPRVAGQEQAFNDVVDD